jgi:rare lipoprotein A
MRNLASRKPNVLGAHRAKRVGQRTLTPALSAGLLTAGLFTIGLAGGSAEAKTPGKSYCFYGKCHRVKTIAETEALVGVDETLSASHYDSCKRDRYNPCGLTSSGAVFDSEAPDNAASPVYPDGTTLLVWAPDTRASVVLRVNNAGPYWGDRKLDVSRKAAEVLGFAGQGVAKLKVRVIDAPTAEEATYKKGRMYDPVPGYIGQFASLEDAQTGAATAYMVAGLTSPFAADPLLGAGNPTQVAQVAGSTGTQSGATVVVPTVLAAVAAHPADMTEVAAKPSETKPVQLAAAIIPSDNAENTAKERSTVAKKAVAEPVARKRAYAERSAPANSRSYRQAARKSRREKAPVAVVAVAAVNEAAGKRIVTQDGTNDMSVFARQTYAGVDRIASQEPMRRRPSYSSLGRGMRDGDEG